MKRQFLLILTAWLSIFSLQAQVQDDFNDGNFSSNPTWLGNTNDFTVNASNELQLDATGPSPRYLSLSANTSTASSTTWEFYLRVDFAPSSNNNARVYLSSSIPDLSDAANLQGYYVQMGGESGTDDALELYRQDGASETLLLRGQDSTMGSAPALARVQITRSTNGEWELLADYTGGSNFVSEGTATDLTYPTGGFFGFWCKFTSSNVSNFFMDDVRIDPVVADVTPPQLLSATPQSANTLLLSFDELLDAATANDAGNYSLNNGINITSAQLQGTSQVLLNLSPNLSNATNYTLDVSDVADFAGNLMPGSSLSFTYYQIIGPNPNDLLISEIMADPSPVVGLPEGEYLELYNHTAFAIDLAGVEITHQSIGGSTVSDISLPSYILNPGEEVFIYDNGTTGFAGSPNSIEVTSLFGITNSGATLQVLDASGNLISEITYTDDWYADEDKADGGWSLELINPDLYCKGAQNWAASVHPTGGTPGAPNSIADNTPDVTPPSLVSLTQVSANSVRLVFDDVLDAFTAGVSSNYQLDGAAVFTTATLEDEQTVLLSGPTFSDQTTYSISVQNVEDCVGNALGSETESFTYFETQPAERYDIIINEIYADPNPPVALPDAEFVELYNRSNKVIDLQGFQFTDASSTITTLPSYLLQPGAYLILTDVDNNVDFSNFGPSLTLNSFPSLNVSGDELQLLDDNAAVIDAVPYALDWYQDSNKDDGGWTLERINPNAPCEARSNWRAASNLVGGTPGSQNSVLDTFPDTQGPDALRAFPLAADTLRLFFSEALSENAVLDLNNYAVSGGLSVTFAELEAPLFNTVRIGLSNSMQVGTTYFLELQSGYTDCIGNPIGLFDSLRLALPELAEAGDVVLNELLFNPVSGGSDYVELYNRSNKVLNAGNWVVANTNELGQAESTENINTDWLLFPGDYLLLSEAPFQVREHYQSTAFRAFMENDLPSFADDEDGIILFAGTAGIGGSLLDALSYEEDWHVPFIDDLNGVSLERIDPSAETQDEDNWHSAAAAFRYGTPGYENSSLRSEASGSALIELPSRTLSPDGDGFEDFLLIEYQLDGLGYVANLQVYDAQGRLVNTLLQSELLAREGQLIWDGSNERGERVRTGPYLLLLEIFNENGDVQRIKEHCVVAEQF